MGNEGKRRRGPKHPGVSVVKPSSARHGWRIKWRDPDTGKECRESIPDPQCRTDEGRRTYAADKSAEIAARKQALEAGTAVRKRTLPIAAAIDLYFDDHSATLKPATVGAYRRAADRLIEWCDRSGVPTCDDLGRPELLRFRGDLAKRKRFAPASGAKRGAQRATAKRVQPSAVNTDLRAVRTILGYLRKLELLPKLVDGAKLSEGLQQFKTPDPPRLIMTPAEIRQLLQAAIDHDAARFAMTRREKAEQGERRDSKHGTEYKHDPLAPFVLFLLLTGARMSEPVGITWGDVNLNEPGTDGRPVGKVAIVGKRGRRREVWLEHMPSLRQLIAAVKLAQGRRAKPGATVFGMTVNEADKAITALADYGAPRRVSAQWLRRTTGSYLTCAPGIFGAASAFMSARQLGHSVDVAEKHYLDTVRGIPHDAKTIEAAMGIEDLAARIVAGVRPSRSAAA